MCSADLREFIEKNHLDRSQDGSFSARDAFGSHDDSDHVYNTARAWYMLRTLNPRTLVWDGPDADYTPFSDDLPWCMVPEKKITVEDVNMCCLPIIREHLMILMLHMGIKLCVEHIVPLASTVMMS